MNNAHPVSELAQSIIERIQRQKLMLEGIDWDKLYKMLPKSPEGERPDKPIILAGAYMASDEQRQQRLIEHILWADKYGVIEKVAAYVFRTDDPESC